MNNENLPEITDENEDYKACKYCVITMKLAKTKNGGGEIVEEEL